MRIFVHIPKNAGMTVRRGLAQQILVGNDKHLISADYVRRVRQTMSGYGHHHGLEHARWRDYDVALRESHRAFAIIRNPWSRVVSRWTYAENAIKTKRGHFHLLTPMTFQEFLEERHRWGGEPYFWHRAVAGWYPQRDYVTDETGTIRCDLLRFGTDDLERYFELTSPLRRRNVSNFGRDYRTFYGPAEFDIVADWYKADIELFGFTFDGDATRHLWKHSASH